MAQDGDQRQDLVNTVMNLRIPRNTGDVPSGYATAGYSRSELRAVISTVSLMYKYR
jgi:hypothetical protein